MEANVQPNNLLNNEYKASINSWGRFGILLGLIGAGLILAALMQLVIMLTMIDFKEFFKLNQAKLIEVMSLPQNFTKVVIMQAFGTLLALALPAYFYAKIVATKPTTNLGLNIKPTFQQLLVVLGIAVVALFLSGAIGEFTKHLPMSAWLKAKAIKMEDDYAKEILMFANMKTIGDYIFSLIMIAVLPAIFEELLFRGAMQKMFIKWFNHPFTAILVTSIIFSAIHMSIYGFYARAILGMVLGYVFYYGKSIWLNILMHFINNAVGVTTMYFILKKGGNINEAMDDSIPIWAGVLCAATMLGLMLLYKKVCEKQSQLS